MTSITITPDDPLAEVVAEFDAGGLSVAELKFAHAILAGETQADAYRMSSPRRQCSKATAAVKGCEWARRPAIKKYLEEARRAGAALGARTAEAYQAKLERLEQLSVDAQQMSAAVKAAELSGRASGHLGVVSDQAMPAPGANELIMTVRARLGDEAGRKMALRLGLIDQAAPTIEGTSNG